MQRKTLVTLREDTLVNNVLLEAGDTIYIYEDLCSDDEYGDSDCDGMPNDVDTDDDNDGVGDDDDYDDDDDDQLDEPGMEDFDEEEMDEGRKLNLLKRFGTNYGKAWANKPLRTGLYTAAALTGAGLGAAASVRAARKAKQRIVRAAGGTNKPRRR